MGHIINRIVHTYYIKLFKFEKIKTVLNQFVTKCFQHLNDVISEGESFKYLGSFVQRDGGFGMGLKHRNKYGWIKWREASGVL